MLNLIQTFHYAFHVMTFNRNTRQNTISLCWRFLSPQTLLSITAKYTKRNCYQKTQKLVSARKGWGLEERWHSTEWKLDKRLQRLQTDRGKSEGVIKIPRVVTWSGSDLGTYLIPSSDANTKALLTENIYIYTFFWKIFEEAVCM